MQVSVIIINYNTFKLTCNCIQSVISHTKNITYEIILVDNGSSECEANLFNLKFPTVKLIVSDTNTGFAGGNNIGIKQAKGEIILLLNSDTELIENSIEICYHYLKTHPGAGVVSPMLIYPDGKIQPQCQRFPSIKLELMEILRLHKLLSPSKRAELMLSSFFDHKNDACPDWLWGTFFMFNKSLLQIFKDKLLPADFFMYGEDKQWCWEIRKHGKEIFYTPATKVIHHLSASSYNKNELGKMQVIHQHEKILVKNYRGNLYWHILKWLQLLKYAILWIKHKHYWKDIKIIYNT